MWVKGREGERATDGESNMETYMTTCETDSQGESAARLRELKPGLCDNLDRWDGVGGGSGVRQECDIYIHT